MKKVLTMLLVILVLITGCSKNDDPQKDDPKPEDPVVEVDHKKEIMSYVKKDKYSEAYNYWIENKKDDASLLETIVIGWEMYLIKNDVSEEEMNNFLNADISDVSDTYLTKLNDSLLKEIMDDVEIRKALKLVYRDGLKDSELFEETADRLMLAIVYSKLTSKDYSFEEYNEITKSINRNNVNFDTYDAVEYLFNNISYISDGILETLINSKNYDFNLNLLAGLINIVLETDNDNSIVKHEVSKFNFDGGIFENLLNAVWGNGVNYSLTNYKKFMELFPEEFKNKDAFKTMQIQIDNNLSIYDSPKEKNGYKETDWTKKQMLLEDGEKNPKACGYNIFSNYIVYDTYAYPPHHIFYVGTDVKNIFAFSDPYVYFVDGDKVLKFNSNNVISYEIVLQQENITMLEVVNDYIVYLLEDNTVGKYNVTTKTTQTKTFIDWDDATAWAQE